MDPLLDALRDTSWWVREAAAEALGDVATPRAVQPLIEMVEKASFPDSRMSRSELENSKREAHFVDSAVKTLASIGDARAVEPLMKALAKVHAAMKAYDGQGYSRTVVMMVIAETLTALGVKGDKRAIEPVSQLIAEYSARRACTRERRNPGFWGMFSRWRICASA